MTRILKSKKGMTITEIILALAILGIISVPIMGIFYNSISLTQLTKRQMEINTVMQVVKGEVTQSVKNSNIEVSVFGSTDKIKLSPAAGDPLYDAVNNETKFLALGSGNLIDSYKYKVKFVAKDAHAILSPNIVELDIKLYNSKDKLLSELKTEILYK